MRTAGRETLPLTRVGRKRAHHLRRADAKAQAADHTFFTRHTQKEVQSVRDNAKRCKKHIYDIFRLSHNCAECKKRIERRYA